MPIWWRGKERGYIYPRNNLLVPFRNCDSTISQCPKEVVLGGQTEIFYRSIDMEYDIPSGYLQEQSNSLLSKHMPAFISALIQ